MSLVLLLFDFFLDLFTCFFMGKIRDPRTAWSRDRPDRIGPRFSKFCWSWSGPRLDFFLGPVPGLELYPGPSWSLNIYGLGPALEFLILSGTRTAPVLVGGSLLQLLDFGQDLLNFPLLHLTSQCLQLQQKWWYHQTKDHLKNVLANLVMDILSDQSLWWK